jgi:hypothetical protein
MLNIEYNTVRYNQFRIVHSIDSVMINKKKSTVRIDQDFHILYRIVHDVVMSWFADASGSLRPGAGRAAAITMTDDASAHISA